ncbi:MAG: RsmB/NOP family class I SAM-dependent RNA methyltransferase [Pararhodobacter sp.]
MTPAARQAAAIAILDRHLAGQPAEAALTQWARASRFAGSGDREAVRDWVFRALRQRRSALALAGGSTATGRKLLLGLHRGDGAAPQGWDGTRHHPAPLDAAEQALLEAPHPALERGERLDCPDWLLAHFDGALGAQADAVLAQLRARAPVFVRVNTVRASLASVQAELEAEGIAAQPHPLAPHALEITANPRRLRQSAALAEGRVELQDVASQAVVAAFARWIDAGAGVLDFCAGGGGKALALAAEGFAVSAHDAAPARMRDLPARAARAGAHIALLGDQVSGQWPAVLADAPCSGSGSWRRSPEAKWALSTARLDELVQTQAAILHRCAALTAPGGVLGYATCSLFQAENDAQITAFLAAHPGWQQRKTLRLTPLDGGDGFFLAVLRRD